MRVFISLFVFAMSAGAFAQVKTINNKKMSCREIAKEVKTHRRVRVGSVLVHRTTNGCNLIRSARPASFKDKSGQTCTVGWKCTGRVTKSKKSGQTRKPRVPSKGKSKRKPKKRKSSLDPRRIKIVSSRIVTTSYYTHTGKFLSHYWRESQSRNYVEKRYRDGYNCVAYVAKRKTWPSGKNYFWASCVSRGQVGRVRKSMEYGRETAERFTEHGNRPQGEKNIEAREQPEEDSEYSEMQRENRAENGMEERVTERVNEGS